MEDEYSTIAAIFYVINTMLGSGINYMASAFSNSGYIFAFCILAFVTLLTVFSIYTLLRTAAKYTGLAEISYSNMAKSKHRYLKTTIDVMTLLCSFFSSLGFQKYINELVNTTIIGYIPDKTPVFYRNLEILILMTSTVILTGLGMIKNLGKLKILSKMCVYCVVSLMGVLSLLNICLGDYISKSPTLTNHKKDYTYSLSWFIMSMFVQANIPPLYPILKNKSRNNLLTIAGISSIFGFFVYGLAGFLGYRLMGNCIGTNDLMKIFLDSNSSLNIYLDTNNYLNPTLSSFLRFLTGYQGICAMIIICVGFPLRLGPATSVITELIPFENPDSYYVHGTIVFLEMAALTSINLIPNISLNLVYGLLGPTAVVSISFLFPSLLYFLYRDKKSMYKNVLSWIIMILSIGYTFFGCYNTIDRFLFNEGLDETCSFNLTEPLNITEIN